MSVLCEDKLNSFSHLRIWGIFASVFVLGIPYVIGNCRRC